MDKIDEIIEVVGFIKDRMITKDDLQKDLNPIKEDIVLIKERVFAIEGKLDGINTRIDREAERNFEQDVRLQKLESK